MKPTPWIQSPHNPTIKRLAKLRRGRRRRQAESFLVDGEVEILRALQSGLTCLGCYEYVNRNGEPIADDRMPIAEIRERVGDQLCRVSQSAFDKIARPGPHGPWVAEMRAPEDDLANLTKITQGIVLVLDRLEKPGNLGAIYRTADAMGVAGILLCDCPGDRFSSQAIRNSRGAVFSVPTASGTCEQVQDFLVKQQARVIAMRVEGSTSIAHLELAQPGKVCAVVLGNEANGLQERWTRCGDQLTEGIMIPMLGRVDSLNVSVCAALILYEYARQTRQHP